MPCPRPPAPAAMAQTVRWVAGVPTPEGDARHAAAIRRAKQGCLAEQGHNTPRSGDEMVSDEGSLLAPHALAIQTSPLRHRVWRATRERRVWRGAVAKKRRWAHACAGVRRDRRPQRRLATAMRQRKSRAVRRAVGR
ncbi:hypothetical protein ERJ75_001032200 [Trypanosoma vivax]|nr:hypothetical protein ERJ75_001032200 [Trypanosoma vivax]